MFAVAFSTLFTPIEYFDKVSVDIPWPKATWLQQITIVTATQA
jgi:hypothetical protein